MLKALQQLLNDGTFPLRKREVPALWKIFNWVDNDLEGIIEKSERPVTKPIVKKGKKK